MRNVMIYCPLKPGTPGIHKRTLDSIFALEWDGQADIVFGKHDHSLPPGDQDARNRDITDKYNQARKLALDGGYDAMMTVEADMILPSNALKRLSQTEYDIAYGLYVSRHGRHPWLVFSEITENVRGSISRGKNWKDRRLFWGNVIGTKGIGLGCTLIDREVLEAIQFRQEDKWIANDWYFAIDAEERGFTQAHDCGVICGHIDGHRTLWPDVLNGWIATDEEEINIEEMMNMTNGKYIALTTLDMGGYYCQPGEEVELDDVVAKILLKRRAIKAKPAEQAEKEKEVKDYGTDN